MTDGASTISKSCAAALSDSEEGLRSARYWRERAEEARAMAEQMLDRVARETMLEIARRYDIMAKLAAEREARRRKPE